MKHKILIGFSIVLMVLIASLISFPVAAQDVGTHMIGWWTVRGPLKVGGTSTFTGAATFNSTITSTGTNTLKRVNVGALGLYLYPLSVTNYSGAVQSTIDTTGKGVLKSIIIGAQQAATLYPSKTVNYGGTLEFAADTLGMLHGTAYLASIDSFSTTGTSKVITWAGATVGDPVMVTPLVPEYSATPDTGCAQYAGYVTAGGGSVTVFRYLKLAGSTYKSGAQFNVMLIARH